MTQAYKWFYLAAAPGYKDSELTGELITLRMTQNDMVEGNNRLAAFVVSHRKHAL